MLHDIIFNYNIINILLINLKNSNTFLIIIEREIFYEAG